MMRDALRSDAAPLFGNHHARKLTGTTLVAQKSSSLPSAPSFVVMRRNSPSFRHTSDTERDEDDVTERGSPFSE